MLLHLRGKGQACCRHFNAPRRATTTKNYLASDICNPDVKCPPFSEQVSLIQENLGSQKVLVNWPRCNLVMSDRKSKSWEIAGAKLYFYHTQHLLPSQVFF